MNQIGPFEMRRLEALSNTIFGVAMTLLAYDLPKASRFANAPDWMELVHAYAQPVIALMISFVVAGVFWLSHHRRLTFAPHGLVNDMDGDGGLLFGFMEFGLGELEVVVVRRHRWRWSE